MARKYAAEFENQMYCDAPAAPLVFVERKRTMPEEEEVSDKRHKSSSSSSSSTTAVALPPPPPPPLINTNDWVYEKYGDTLYKINPFPQTMYLRFEEAAHEYYFQDRLIKNGSVSTIKDLFVPGFMEHRAMSRVFHTPSSSSSSKFKPPPKLQGNYSGMDRAGVLRSWKTKASQGTDGHRKIHEFLNCPVLYDMNAPQWRELLLRDVDKHAVHPSNPKFNQYIALEAFLMTFQEITNMGYRVFVTETMMYDEELDVCGTVDAIFRHKVSGDFMVLDWKFCKGSLQSDCSYISEGYAPNEVCYCYYPFDEFPVSKLNGYSIQVHLYARIFERFYLKWVANSGALNTVVQLFIAQFDGTLKVPKVKLYPVAYRRDLVDCMIGLIRRDQELPLLYENWACQNENLALQNVLKIRALFPSTPRIPRLPHTV